VTRDTKYYKFYCIRSGKRLRDLNNITIYHRKTKILIATFNILSMMNTEEIAIFCG
jgi:hypothetical protein